MILAGHTPESPDPSLWYLCHDGGPLLLARVEPVGLDGALLRAWPAARHDHPESVKRLAAVLAAHCDHVEYMPRPGRWRAVWDDDAAHRPPGHLLLMPADPSEVPPGPAAECYHLLCRDAALLLPLSGEGTPELPFAVRPGPPVFLAEAPPPGAIAAETAHAARWLSELPFFTF